MPPLDRDALQAWATDADLTILQQDEDLMLADAETLPLLKEFIQGKDTLPAKRSVLLSALCILIYDNIPDEDDPSAAKRELQEDATQFLVDNIQLFQTIDDGYIYHYVKLAVYPRIGLRPPIGN